MTNVNTLVAECNQISDYEREEERTNNLVEANWELLKRLPNSKPRLVVDNTVAIPAITTPLVPNKANITAHLSALFSPAFVHPYPGAWIEIAYGQPDGKLNKARNFSAFDLEKAVEFAVAKNAAGYNVYVGAAIRHGDKPDSGRANGDHVVTASHAWAEYDGAGDDERIQAILKEHSLKPAIVVTTGTVPHPRRHLYFRLDGATTPDQLEAANTSLMTLLGTDLVWNADRVMRLAGTVSHPSPKKVGHGYVTELTALTVNKDARAYFADELIKLAPASGAASGDPFADYGKENVGRSKEEVMTLLKASHGEQWHNPMREAIASMIGWGWPDSAIKMNCAMHSDGSYNDADVQKLIDDGRKKWNKPNIEQAPSNGNDTADVVRLNKTHAVLPIGDKTRVVTFGELEEFPGRETIVATQTLGDFQALQNKYRHAYRDAKGEDKQTPLGSHWIQSTDRRQYDGGMEFMPQRDGDFGNKLNLWRGFGVKAVKPAPNSRGETGCQKFLAFMKDIICSGNEDDFNYLLRREATILQKKIRSEIALGLRTKEEGCGKGFYEKVMGRLLGNHAMQVSNPKHIIGNFNPHLQTLLRLTADEALFVGNHEHRNALFGLITEPKLTIEPKGCGVYQADNYLNLSIASNSDHFVPVSGSARRFFIPTVSIARKQDVVYFGDMESDLDAGGYEALLYYFLHEVDLAGFSVRKVPQTAGLREQRNQSLEALDSWWVELLETGTLMGADPQRPNGAVSNSYQRKIEVEGGYGSTQIRYVIQRGLYDQAKLIEPKLRNTSDHMLGKKLSEMGGDNSRKVLRKQGWWLPPLLECRAAWVERYPNWNWRNPAITEWQQEEDIDGVEAIETEPALVVDNSSEAIEAAKARGARF